MKNSAIIGIDCIDPHDHIQYFQNQSKGYMMRTKKYPKRKQACKYDRNEQAHKIVMLKNAMLTQDVIEIKQISKHDKKSKPSTDVNVFF